MGRLYHRGHREHRGGSEVVYNDGSDGIEGGRVLPGVAVVGAVVVKNARCPLCSLW
jgi:hypothetical protein